MVITQPGVNAGGSLFQSPYEYFFTAFFDWLMFSIKVKEKGLMVKKGPELHPVISAPFGTYALQTIPGKGSFLLLVL